jgi:hypothetical protein
MSETKSIDVKQFVCEVNDSYDGDIKIELYDLPQDDDTRETLEMYNEYIYMFNKTMLEAGITREQIMKFNSIISEQITPENYLSCFKSILGIQQDDLDWEEAQILKIALANPDNFDSEIEKRLDSLNF